MKKIVSLILVFIFLLSASVFSKEEISVLVDGVALEFLEQPPVIIEGRTLVPLRKIFEALGAEVDWDNETKTAISKKADKLVKIQIDSKIININGINIPLDVPAQLINNKTLVPVRAISEAFNSTVSWDEDNRIVSVKTEEYVKREISFLKYTSKEFDYTVFYPNNYKIAEENERASEVIFESPLKTSVFNIQSVFVDGFGTDKYNAITEDELKSLMETDINNFKKAYINNIPTVSYSFRIDDLKMYQMIYFCNGFVHTITCGTIGEISEKEESDILFFMKSLNK